MCVNGMPCSPQVNSYVRACILRGIARGAHDTNNTCALVATTALGAIPAVLRSISCASSSNSLAVVADSDRLGLASFVEVLHCTPLVGANGFATDATPRGRVVDEHEVHVVEAELRQRQLQLGSGVGVPARVGTPFDTQ